MSAALYIAAFLAVAVGAAHSYLGARSILTWPVFLAIGLIAPAAALI